MTNETTSTEPKKRPVGTSPEYGRMHTIVRRVCYVLLFGLVIEGALTFPLLAIWYGVPQLSPTEVCSDLQKVMYDDKGRECRQPYPLGGPPFGGKGEGEGQTTSRDVWGIQPKPGYPAVGFRQFVREKEAREAEDDANHPTTTTTTPK